VNELPDRPLEAKLDDGDFRDRFPASAVGLHAKSTPVNSTWSNTKDDGERPSVSPVVPASDVQLIRHKADGVSASISQAGEPSICVVRADTASNRNRKPDDASTESSSSDEALYNNVRFNGSHNGVRATSEYHNGVLASNENLYSPEMVETAENKTLTNFN